MSVALNYSYDGNQISDELILTQCDNSYDFVTLNVTSTKTANEKLMTSDETLNVTLSNVVILPLMVTVTFAVKVWNLGWVTYGARVFSISVTMTCAVMTRYLY